MEKAIREAKLYTSWTAPDEAYENGVKDFLAALLDPKQAKTAAWREEMHAFVGRIARPGLWTALSRVVLHLAAPGTPDLYQGDELWSFALVDPDNRRPVDYALRERLLGEIERIAEGGGEERALRALVAAPEDGRIKLHVTRAVLQARRRFVESFAGGAYRALDASGSRARHVVAFARGDGVQQVVVIVPRFVLALGAGEGAPVGHETWGETHVVVPARGTSDSRWRCAISGRTVEARRGRIELASALDPLPVALLVPLGSST
jgi:(1->4)-alpha-D-glucan 1-alpha-D-glucosylmutase